MKEKEFVLLIGKKNYLVRVLNEKFSTQYGIVDLSKLKNKKFGDKIKTHSGGEFILVKPNFLDILMKKCKRLPQIITPKDASLILAYTGVASDAKIVDAGSGSGFLAMFLAYYCGKGKVVTYERNREFAKTVKKNIEKVGLKNIRVKESDVLKEIQEKNLDLITLDMKDAERMITKSYKSLKLGGWLVVYSPYIEQVKEVANEMKKYFNDIFTVESIVREWQAGNFTRPKSSGIMHTGFLTFARK